MKAELERLTYTPSITGDSMIVLGSWEQAERCGDSKVRRLWHSLCKANVKLSVCFPVSFTSLYFLGTSATTV